MRMHPRLNWRDIGYAGIGAFLCWQSFPADLWAAAWLWFLCLLAYCAGRAVGASHD